MRYSPVRFLMPAVIIFVAFFGTHAVAQIGGKTFVIDMTYAIPTFRQGDIAQVDLNSPVKKSRPIASFSPQAILIGLPNFPTGDGYLPLNRLVLNEHHGTHIDAPVHFVNNPNTIEVLSPDKRTTEELTGKDLMGPVGLIDISRRVQSELDKNGGQPSPDTNVTNFSDASGNVVTAADIDVVADQLASGTWLMVHTGWEQFYWESGPGLKGPYINGFNFPGISKAAVDRLIEIENQKGIRINGIGMDQIQIDTGANADAPKFQNAFPAHVRGMQRGWKLLENVANTGMLAQAKSGSCQLVVGALKHVGGSGGAARVFALCER
jgi:kynurenine formamidase